MKPVAHSKHGLASLASAVDEAADLLRSAGASRAASAGQRATSDASWLDECVQACRGLARAPLPVLRVVRHLPHSGGRLISAAIAALPNVRTLDVSNLLPLACPDGANANAMAPFPASDRAALQAIARASIAALTDHATSSGRYLVVRDDTYRLHLDCVQPGAVDGLSSLLTDGVATHALLVVRHPLDSYSSLVRRNRSGFEPPTLAEYAERYLAFLDDNRDVPRVRFESYIADPVTTLCKSRSALQLPDSTDVAHLVSRSIDLGEGRGVPIPAVRSRGDDVLSLLEKARGMASIRRLCELLDYPLDADAVAVPPRLPVPQPLPAATPESVDRPECAIPPDLGRQLSDLSARFEAQREELIRIRKHFDFVIRKELLNATRQVEAFVSVQAAVAGADPLPEMHGWPISADFAAYLVELLRENDYDAIVEFGSGTSTYLIAKLLTLRAARDADRPSTTQVAFEHIAQYQEQTVSRLRGAGLDRQATVHLSALTPYVASDGRAFNYYDCAPALETLRRSIGPNARRVLVVVDGPPASTGENARYPALPILLNALPDVGMDILLDDYVRPDEQAVVAQWQRDLRSAGRVFETIVRKMEKDACLIRITASQAATTHAGARPSPIPPRS